MSRLVSFILSLCVATAAHPDTYADPGTDSGGQLRTSAGDAVLGKIPTASADVPAWDENTPFAAQVRHAAKASNVQPELLHAVISAESRYQPAARSPAGAVGLMQLMPGIGKRYNVKNLLDPQQNIHAGARYLRDLMDMFKDNVSLVLAAYNAGEHAVVRHGNRIPPFSETRAYVSKVMALYAKLTSASGAGRAIAESAVAGPVLQVLADAAHPH